MYRLIFRQPARPLLASLVILVALLAVGTAGYRLLEGMSPLDSLYMTVTTITTVGFGEVKPLSPAGRVFTMGLIFGGVGLAAFVANMILTAIVFGDLRGTLQMERRRQMLSRLTNHTIVCGYGRVGRNVTHELKREGLPLVVIDKDPQRVNSAQQAGFLAIQGNAANEAQLIEAGIRQARHLVTAVSSDAENVFIVLTARGLQPDLFIVARANYEESEPKLIKAGANRVITPYSISGRRMVSLLVRPDVADFLDEVMHSSGLELFLEQVTVHTGSPLAGQTLWEVQLRSTTGVTVLACKPAGGGLITAPRPEMILEPDMLLIVLGTQEQLRALAAMAGDSTTHMHRSGANH